MFIRPWLEALKSRWMPGKRRNPQRLKSVSVESHPESLEEKVLPAAFQLVTVIPNQGVFLTDGTTMTEAPRELTLRFSPGQVINANTLSAITVVSAGLDGVLDDQATAAIESTDDTNVPLGYVGIGDNPNEVIVRFASTLADDQYQLRVQASGPNLLVGNNGDALTPDVGKSYKSFTINVDLGAQIEAIVPQPVVRSQVFTVANAASSLANGDTLTITNGPYVTVLEFNTAAINVLPGHVFVNRTGSDAAVATAIANAINGLGQPTEVALSASASGQTVTIAGTAFEPTVSFGNPVLNVVDVSRIADGDQLILTQGSTIIGIEFNNTDLNNVVTPGFKRIDFAQGTLTQAGMISAIVSAINTPSQPIQAVLRGTSIVIQGSNGTPEIHVKNAATGAFAVDYTSQSLVKTVVTVANAASLSDGDTLTLSLNGANLIFEFNNLSVNNVVSPGRIRINYTTGATANTIAAAINTAVNSAVNNPAQNIRSTQVGTAVAITGTTGSPAASWNTLNTGVFTQNFGSLTQATDQVVVYFNQDELDAAIAEDPAYYKLLYSLQTLLNVNTPSTLADGDVLNVSLGNTHLVFEFNDLEVNNAVTPGHIQIDFSHSTAAGGALATAIANGINSMVNNPAQVILAAAVGSQVSITGNTSGTPSANWTTATQGTFTQSDPIRKNVLLPETVNYFYNAQTGINAAVLTFASALPQASYNLKVGLTAEPNNSTATAVNLGTIFSTQDVVVNEYLGDGTGSSTDASDVDLYKFTLATAGVATFTLNSSSTLDGVITFLDSTGTPVAMAGNPADSTATGGNETLTTGMLGAGTFYVQVSSKGALTTGGYTLSIHLTSAVGGNDNNSSFGTATNLGDLGTGGLVTSGNIETQGAFVTLMPQMPGGSDEPGHRELPTGPFTGLSAPELGHGTGTTGDPGTPIPISQYTYSFPLSYSGALGVLQNEITPEQKEIIRQIFQIYSYIAGVQFYEVPSGGAQQIVVGDMRSVVPTLPPPGPGGISGTPIVLNSLSFRNENEFGGGFTSTAFHEIGHNLGLGHSYDLPSIQGGSATVGPVESYFTGDNDLIHLLRVHPNSASDIDLYKFNVAQTGTLSAQTIAERLGGGNLLNSVLTLYRQDGTTRTVVARNDDFYSKDSGLEVPVTPGTYYIGVTSTGNDNYDPSISNSGFGGRSEGFYQLKLDFKPTDVAANELRDLTGRLLDGDHNGQAGGEFNSWFNVAPTIFVDKLATGAPNGSVTAPYQTISSAIAAAAPGDIVRIVGNGGADRDSSTLTDNVPYTIGRDYNVAQTALADGDTFQVPQGVTVMIDAGALIKLHAQNLDVGTSSAGVDRNHGALQVLGTPMNNVTFTSWRDDSKGSVDDGTNGNATGADWGGIVFRQNSDSAIPGFYVNTVNHATLQYGGGSVAVDGAQPRIYNVINLETSRPTITNNTIQNNADAAISANPDSFKADDGRIGPDIHGNYVTNNSTNGLFVRIATPLGGAYETLNVIARFDDTDITHVLTQNLVLNGRPAGALSNPVSARLMIDPGTIVKLSGARIETGIGSSNLIAEGTAENPIRFTSQQDDRFGAGGTFDVKNDGSTAPTPGNWSGIYVGQTSTASLDHVLIAYAGGASEIAGNSDYFNPVEVLQGTLRVTNSTFQNNAGGLAATSRAGKGGNDNSTIFVRASQPVLINNVFQDNVGNVVSINANSMQNVVMPDYGRSTGLLSSFPQFDDNYGPLVRLNKFANSTSFAQGVSTLGMNIRAEELTIESIWDDTDIAHVVRGTITSNEFHTYGGLTLQSSSTGSLVIKLEGASAGFRATGDPLEITDRIGGTIDVIGQPGFPVILTSLRDDSVSAGFKPNGFPQFDTNGDNNNPAGASNNPNFPTSTPSVGQPGDWNSLSFDQLSNDTNVAIVNETETPLTQGNDLNGGVGNPQSLGNLAPNLNSGDENRRLGYEVHGFISPDSPGDVDVYSFTANAGTEVWIDTDFTSQRLDVMVELLNSAGTVLARSLDSNLEYTNPGAWLASGLAGTLAAGATANNSLLNPLIKDRTLGTDFYTSNFHDAGFRAVLPGTAGTPITYFVRVRSQPVAGQEQAAIPVGGNGLTSGAYQLQVRLKQVDDIPGSTIRYADIRYATNGIETHGLPAHSPLMGEISETSNNNNSADGGQFTGALLQQDRNTISISGNLDTATDVDFYTFTVDYSQIQVAIPGPKFFPTIFDLDWADGLTRPNTLIAVYNSNRDLIYIGRDSDVADDQAAPTQNQDLDDLTRSSLGKLDPYIGAVDLPASANGGNSVGAATRYYVAVFSNAQLPSILTANFVDNASAANQRVRLEPINSVKRVVEDHIGFTGYGSQLSNVAPTAGPMFNIIDSISLEANIRPFTLSDVNLFVSSASGMIMSDPFNGTTEIVYNGYSLQTAQDMDMRSDGTLWVVRSPVGNPQSGQLVQISTANGSDASTPASDGIADRDGDTATARFQSNQSASDALAWHEVVDANAATPNYDAVYYATLDSDDYNSNAGDGTVSKLYRGRPSGDASWQGATWGASGHIIDNGGLITTATTGLQFLGNALWGVSSAGQLYQISTTLPVGNDNGSNIGNPNSTNTPNTAAASGSTQRLVFDASIKDYSGFLNPGETFAGLSDAPKNVENERFADWLFIITSTGRLLCVDPNAGSVAASMQRVFDTTGDGLATGADSFFLQTGLGSATGLGFSPADFNLWHPTERRTSDLGHGILTTQGALDPVNPTQIIDNSRVPSAEPVSTPFGAETLDSNQGIGGGSFYFGLEEYGNNRQSQNYFEYDSGGQYGVRDQTIHRDLASNGTIGNNYNLPGGTAGSLITNSFSLEGYESTDRPTLYFNYWLQTENAAGGNSANQMRDSARVFVSVDNGVTWSLAATNNSALSSATTPDNELPAYLSTDASASAKSNQGVQELYESASWRQARVDLGDYVGSSTIKLRFDFSTWGRSGSVPTPGSGVNFPSDDQSARNYANEPGTFGGVVAGGTAAMAAAQNNTAEGFYIDDIIVGFAGRGEMVTGSHDLGTAFTNLLDSTQITRTKDPDVKATQQLLTGGYQLEIRRGENYAGLVDPPTPQGLNIINPPLDINDRMTNGETVRVGNTISAGNSVTIYDGLYTYNFIFGGVTNAPARIFGVPIGGTPGANASNLANAINNVAFAATHNVIADAVSPSTNSDRVDIYGAITVSAIGTPPTVTALGGESDPAGGFGTGNDYPANSPIQVANTMGAAFSTNGTDGYYTLTGTIGNGPHPTADSDFFQVHLTQGQSITIDFTKTGGTGSNYVLGILDDSFNIGGIAFNNSLTFTASATADYFIGVLGDDGDVLTPPIDPNFAFSFPNPPPLATTGNDTFTYLLDISLVHAGASLPTPLSVDTYVRQGDDNLTRTQGQFIIENNTILYSEHDGILIDDDERLNTIPHPGATINTSPQNTQGLITGMYIQNNVIARFGDNGINLLGDGNVTNGSAITPFVKIVNNTFYGADQTSSTTGGLTDIVFLIDDSGSMDPDIAILVAQLLTFDTAMQAANIDAHYGLVQFPRDFPNVEPKQTQDIVDFATFTLPGSPFRNIVITGGTESGAVAIMEGLNDFDPTTTFNFRTNSQKILVMLTNEDDDSTPAQQAAAAVSLAAANAVFFAIADSQFGTTVQDYGPLATNSGGGLFELSEFENNTAVFFQAFIAAVTGVVSVGAVQGVGINVGAHTSPTIMNNVFANTVVGINIDPTSTTSEVEANLFQNNNDDGLIGTTVYRGNNALFGSDTSGKALFVNTAANNFYPAVNSPLVDSSRNNFNDRGAYIAVTGPLSIPPSPIFAPNYDRFGQLRVDDTDTPSPANQPGLGTNPFQDRGAIERADFTGGQVIPKLPLDNDGAGVDYDPTLNTIWIDAANPTQPFTIQTQFVLQLIDAGIGIDDSTVDLDGSDFVVLQNGVPLVQGTDYFFTYNQNTNEAIFTSVSTFPLDSRYQIVVNAFGITDFAGNFLQNNQSTAPTAPTLPDLPNLQAPFDSSLLYFTYIVTDGDNDAPVTTSPSAVSTNEDVPFVFNGSNLISVSDSDAFLSADGDPNYGPGRGRIQVTVYVPDGFGTISSGGTATLLANGGSFIGTGSASDPYVINGRVDDINLVLATLQYSPPANFPTGLPAVVVPLTVFSEDFGKFGPPAPGNVNPQSSTRVINITINPVNDPPTLTTIGAQTMAEDSGTKNVPLAGISAGGGETQALTVTVSSNDTNLFPTGSMVVNYTSPNGTGSIDFTPAPNRFTQPGVPARITVSVRDAGLDGIAGNSDDQTTSRTFDFTVTPVNDRPSVGTISNQTVAEDSGTTSITLTGVSAGPFESQILNFIAVSSDPTIVPNPVVTYVQGSNQATLAFTPAANRNGTVTISVTVVDDGGNSPFDTSSPVQTFDITVTPVNDPPTMGVIPSSTIGEDAGLQTINLTGISTGPADESGQTLTFSVVNNTNPTLIPTGGITINYTPGNTTGTLTYQSAPELSGSATITVRLDDGVGGTLDRTFTVVVNPLNDAPTLDFIPNPAAINEDDGQQTINLTGITTGPPNEAGQTPLTVTAVSSNPGLIPNPTVSYTSPNNFGSLTYTPVANVSGTATITVTVTDNGGTLNGGVNTFTRTFDVVVNAVNDDPTLAPIANPLPILEDAGTQTINLTGITAGLLETQALEVTATSNNSLLIPNGNISVSYTSANPNGTISYTPAPNQNGTATITVQVRDAGLNLTLGDGDDGFTTRTFLVDVTPVNDAPTIDTLNDLTISEDASTQTINMSGITVGAANEADQNLTISAVSSNPTLIPNPIVVNYTSANPAGTLVFTPVPNANSANTGGSATITVTLTDNGGTSNGGVTTTVRTFVVNVTPVPDAPTNINLSNSAIFENRPVGTVVGTLTTNDVDLPADSHTYTIVGGTGIAAFQINGNQLQAAQLLDFETQGSYTLMIRTTDQNSQSFDKLFTIQILNLNDAPTLNTIANQSFDEDSGAHVINLAGISAGFGESQTLTITATSDVPTLFANPIPVNYSSPSATGTLTLTPLPNQNGTATITVTVTDNGGTLNGGVNTFTRTFTVTVNAVNDAPTSVNISVDTIPEIPAGTQLPANVLVGQLTSTDPDAGDSFQYQLVSGAGGADNTKFQIVNDQLFALGPIDFDTQPDYTIRVRSTDTNGTGLSFDQVLTIHATNVNEPATSIGTAANPNSSVPNSIPENLPPGSVVGTLVAGDPDANETNTFALVSGPGATDNALFNIVNGQLIALQTFNYELKNSYSVRLKVTDSQGLTFESQVTIAVTNVNESPTQINLSNSTVVENTPAGTPVGNLSTTDIDGVDTFTYSLVNGAGSNDNAKFSVSGNQLLIAVPPNYEDNAGHFYSVRVRSTDAGGLTVERTFTITITDVNENPTALTLSSTSINENKAIGSTVGTFTTADQDSPETFTYALVSGLGSTDNASFAISNDRLVTAEVFNFEARSNYSVRVRTTDSQGHSFEQVFTITVNDTLDAPVISLADAPITTTGHKIVVIDPAATLTDIDSDDMGGGRLVVRIQEGEQTGDLLSIRKDTSSGLLLKAVRGKTVLRLGKGAAARDIATISGGVRGIPLTIQFGGQISKELFQLVMRNITFRGKPFAAPRVVSMQAFDEAGLGSNIETRNINVT